MRACVKFLLVGAMGLALPAWSACEKPVYLTIDTGHMGVASLVADVLRRHQVKATFFLSNERTRSGGSSLDDEWAGWWKARVEEGHVFGSHTWNHSVWRADMGARGLRTRPTAGVDEGKLVDMTPAEYCADLMRPATRLREMTGARMVPIFRAPGGKTSPALLKIAQGCGWKHVPWTAAGFLGDELPSDRHPNDALLKKALKDIKTGDIMLMHLGIWSRKQAWAPGVLEPLIEGLKERGLCFATMDEHPDYRAWVKSHPKRP